MGIANQMLIITSISKLHALPSTMKLSETKLNILNVELPPPDTNDEHATKTNVGGELWNCGQCRHCGNCCYRPGKYLWSLWVPVTLEGGIINGRCIACHPANKKVEAVVAPLRPPRITCIATEIEGRCNDLSNWWERAIQCINCPLRF